MYLKVRINNLKNRLNFLEGYGNVMQNPNQVVLFFVQNLGNRFFMFYISGSEACLRIPTCFVLLFKPTYVFDELEEVVLIDKPIFLQVLKKVPLLEGIPRVPGT